MTHVHAVAERNTNIVTVNKRNGHPCTKGMSIRLYRIDEVKGNGTSRN
jgi:hypothetical protein